VAPRGEIVAAERGHTVLKAVKAKTLQALVKQVRTRVWGSAGHMRKARTGVKYLHAGLTRNQGKTKGAGFPTPFVCLELLGLLALEL
jgi:hypothetical protein